MKKVRSDAEFREGERYFIAGSTGSGKTLFTTENLRHYPYSPIVIYDTKADEKFPLLPRSTIVETYDDVIKQTENEEFDYVIFRPDALELTEPAVLDGYLYRHYEELHRVPAYIDEAYSFHRAGRAGPGLTALLTRGRSRGITTIMATQRPAWISGFCMSEASAYFIFRLQMLTDRKKMAEIIPEFDKLPLPPDFHFYYYRVGDKAAQLMKPVKPRKGVDTGYVPVQSGDTKSSGSVVAAPRYEWL